MSRNHFMVPTAPSQARLSVRLGASAAALTHTEVGKAVKLAAESQFSLCVAGDPIEAFVSSVELGTQNQFTIAGVHVPRSGDMVLATADGLQATAGTGTIAVGDFVVTGTVTAAGTALTAYQRVTKATQQPGVTEAGAVGDVNDQLKVALYAYRVVSVAAFGGTGAVGDTIVLMRV